MPMTPMTQMNATPMASWQAQTRTIHIRKVVIGCIIFAAILTFAILALTVPTCNSTQVRGFFTCNCAPGSAMNHATGLCMCLEDAATPGGQCDPESQNIRYVYKAIDQDTIGDKANWSYSRTM